jgi:hypothetical protein
MTTSSKAPPSTMLALTATGDRHHASRTLLRPTQPGAINKMNPRSPMPLRLHVGAALSHARVPFLTVTIGLAAGEPVTSSST